MHMTLQKQLEYVHPEVLVDTQWVEDHLNDPKVRIAEVDYDRVLEISSFTPF